MSFGAFGKEAGFKPLSDINTTPMVDVMLVLLIIFMVTVPLLTHTVPVKLPKAGSGIAEEKPGSVDLSVDAKGLVYWDNKQVNDDGLAAKLKEAALKTPQPEVRLRADRESRYAVIAHIISTAQGAGLSRLGFLTEPEKP